jgi:plastocyanin
MRRIVAAVFAAALTFFGLSAPSLAGACRNTTPPAEGTSADVRVDHCMFQPGVLRVPVGTTVRWTNDDVFPHVISGIGWGRTEPMITGGAFSQMFTEKGIFPYTCTLHPGMSAVVLVGDVAAAAAPPTPAQRGQDGSGLALALLASIVVGITSFVAGRSFR